MLRRLHPDQPDSFAFTPENKAWAEAQISKYPEGREASAVIPLLWRAQEQEGWLSKPAIEAVADMLGMAYMRALEVASFYFMFQMQPVGRVAHIQICGTTSCMICGAEDLVGVCKEKIAPNPFELSADGKFSWEEVECLGACANAPMAQIGKDYYEDLTTDRFAEILDELAAGEVPLPGPQNGRFASEPEGGLTTLSGAGSGAHDRNASVHLAATLEDTVKRIDGTEVPLIAPWRDKGANHRPAAPGEATRDDPVESAAKAAPEPRVEAPVDETGASKPEAQAKEKARPDREPAAEPVAEPAAIETEQTGTKPETLTAPREGAADDLKMIKGVGPKLEEMLHGLGFYHFDQIANWTEAEVAWVDRNLTGFNGRVSRDDWVAQARTLASGESTEFSKKVKKGDVY